MAAFSEPPTSDPPGEDYEHEDPRPRMGQPAISAAQTLLPIALGAAVPWRVYEIYERGGPLPADWQRLQQIAPFLEERGDLLLFRNARKGETAELFNALAEALAILSFVPGGVPFGKERFDALQILTGFLGEERANTYIAQVRQGSAE